MNGCEEISTHRINKSFYWSVFLATTHVHERASGVSVLIDTGQPSRVQFLKQRMIDEDQIIFLPAPLRLRPLGYSQTVGICLWTKTPFLIVLTREATTARKRRSRASCILQIRVAGKGTCVGKTHLTVGLSAHARRSTATFCQQFGLNLTTTWIED